MKPKRPITAPSASASSKDPKRRILTICQFSVCFTAENHAQSHFDTKLDARREVFLSPAEQGILAGDCGFEGPLSGGCAQFLQRLGVILMRMRLIFAYGALATLPAAAQETALAIELIPGHPVYHEGAQEAGVAMALAITPDQGHPADLAGLCDELRIAAGLDGERGGLRLETIFVVPYKSLAVEGSYWPDDDSLGSGALIPGDHVPRARLDDIVARAGIPPGVLDETGVEQEIACATGEPRWDLTWSDVQRIGEESPDAVIERAHDRFMAIHQSVVEHSAAQQQIRQARRTTQGG